MTETPSVLDSLGANKSDWRCQFELDVEGWWWLTQEGRRTQRTRWRPRDEVEVLVAATLLYELNDAGPIPLGKRYLDAAKQGRMDESQLRTWLDQQAYHLQIRLRTGRPRPPTNVPPGWQP